MSDEAESPRSGVDRREVLKLGALGAVAGSVGSLGGARLADAAERGPRSKSGTRQEFRAPHPQLEEVTIAELQRRMEEQGLTSATLTRQYIERIQALNLRGPELRGVLEINPDALEIAGRLDQERKAGRIRGPLHGIPVLLKDNIGTADKMDSAAGSLALVDFSPPEDSTVAARLREAGAVLLGKTNLSEWANFRAFFSSSGWSGRGGQSKNPFILDRNPCGSSSCVPVSANMCPVSVGTETDGSIVCPASACGVVGLKPTVGLTSRKNVIPIAETQDTIGPHARTVADAATLLEGMVSLSPDPDDPATKDGAANARSNYRQFLDPNGLAGARIGVPRDQWDMGPEARRIGEDALEAIEDAGAVIVDDLSLEDSGSFLAEFFVLLIEFQALINEYLAQLPAGAPPDLEALIEFNEAHPESELQFFGQEIFRLALGQPPIGSPAHLDFLARSRDAARSKFLQVIEENDLDAFVAPTASPAWTTDLPNGDLFLGASSSVAARAGFPLITLPAGFFFGLPVGITFMGRPWAEPTLITLASGFEAATGVRRAPEFQPTLEEDTGVLAGPGDRQGPPMGRGMDVNTVLTQERRGVGPM